MSDTNPTPSTLRERIKRIIGIRMVSPGRPEYGLKEEITYATDNKELDAIMQAVNSEIEAAKAKSGIHELLAVHIATPRARYEYEDKSQVPLITRLMQLAAEWKAAKQPLHKEEP